MIRIWLLAAGLVLGAAFPVAARDNGVLMRRVIEMFGEGRSCVDLAQQLHAVEKAIGEAKRTLIHDHVDHCLDAAANGTSRSAGAVVDEFKAISKYL